MVEVASIDVELDRLERDPVFQRSVQNVSPGRFASCTDENAFQSYRRYNRELHEFVEAPEIMKVVLDDPATKIWFLRVFGYRGEAQFSIRHTVWIRDLPLLEIGRDSHLGYGMVLGTNRPSADGSAIHLEPIRIGARTLFHQHCIVEGGSEIGSDCRIGIRGLIGRDCRIGDDVVIDDFTQIGEGAIIGDGARIGLGAGIGQRAIVDPGISVGAGEEVPAHHRLTVGGLFPRPHRRPAARRPGSGGFGHIPMPR